MAISSNATGLRPGVCTSTTRPTTPYTGQIIYETDTGYLRVWDGSAWDYLSQKQDTTQGLPAGDSMGLVYITQATISSSAGFTISNCFSATYDNYRVIISGVIGSVVGTLNMRIGTANTGYYGSLYYDLYTGASTGTNRYNNAAQVPATFYSNVNDEGISTFDIMHPFDAKRTTWAGNYYGGTYAGWFGITLANETSYTDLYLYPSSGTFSGRVRVYGYRET